MTEQDSTRVGRWQRFSSKVDSAPFAYRFGGVVVLAAYFALLLLGPDIPILRNGELQRIIGGTIVGRSMVWLLFGIFWWPAGIFSGYLYWTMLGNEVSHSEQ